MLYTPELCLPWMWRSMKARGFNTSSPGLPESTSRSLSPLMIVFVPQWPFTPAKLRCILDIPYFTVAANIPLKRQIEDVLGGLVPVNE